MKTQRHIKTTYLFSSIPGSVSPALNLGFQPQAKKQSDDQYPNITRTTL